MSVEENAKWGEFIPQGWKSLFEQLVRDLAALDENPVIVEAKQKFGRLRVYLDRGSEGAHQLIDEGSRVSLQTCERCGAPGRLMVQRNGFYETLCTDHQGTARLAGEDPIVASFRLSGDGTLRQVE